MIVRPRYMLDTNICIDLMKHQPPQVVERFSSCKVGVVMISAITAAELEDRIVASGADVERNNAPLAALVLEVPVAPFHRVTARFYGAVRLTSHERRRDALDLELRKGLCSENCSRRKGPRKA